MVSSPRSFRCAFRRYRLRRRVRLVTRRSGRYYTVGCTSIRVIHLTALDGTDTKSLYRIEWAEGIDGLINAFRDHGLIVEQATGTDEEWTFHLRAPEQAAIDAFHQEPRIRDTALSIRNVTHTPDGEADDRQPLTAKQHEAVLLAVERGHFQVPRETSLTELADELDISRQAFTRHLHRGLHNLLTAWL